MSSNRRVLVVDDSAFMRRLASQVIEASGEFSVPGTARNGHDALKQIYAIEPDIVTLDVDMPLDGLSTLGSRFKTCWCASRRTPLRASTSATFV